MTDQNSTENSENTNTEIPIVFYCKDCREVIKAEKIGTKYNYKCTTCNGENVAFGTPKSISNFYHTK